MEYLLEECQHQGIIRREDGDAEAYIENQKLR
jgi:hypothetical protein